MSIKTDVATLALACAGLAVVAEVQATERELVSKIGRAAYRKQYPRLAKALAQFRKQMRAASK